VLSPPLRRRIGDPEGELPHVYYLDDGDVILCMLDPGSNEWSPLDRLAETTVPWIIDWLASYEGWRATGRWTGSGRHVEQSRIPYAARARGRRQWLLETAASIAVQDAIIARPQQQE
jgi:hypothetical protein